MEDKKIDYLYIFIFQSLMCEFRLTERKAWCTCDCITAKRSQEEIAKRQPQNTKVK